MEEASETRKLLQDHRMHGANLCPLLSQRVQLALRLRSCHQSVQLPHYSREELYPGNLPSVPEAGITAGVAPPAGFYCMLMQWGHQSKVCLCIEKGFLCV